jgi:hypothetical protein
VDFDLKRPGKSRRRLLCQAKRTQPLNCRAQSKKIIPSLGTDDPEKAEISVESADPLYREIRVENKLQDEQGKEVELQPGAKVYVTIEADEQATSPKKPQSDGKLQRK